MRVVLTVLAFGVLVGLARPGQRSPSEPASVSQGGRSAGGTSSGGATRADAVLAPVTGGCANSIRDQSNPSSCLQATSVPTSGLLFPGPHLGGVNNVQSGTNSFVGGGQNNQATAAGGIGHTTVGGGYGNVASGFWSTVGGGRNNQATMVFAGAGTTTVGGGGDNVASGDFATIGGGSYNSAADGGATVAGGVHSTALGNFSFAAGRQAKANHDGAFVWGDSQAVDKTSSAADEFNVYASGGARIFSDSTATSGVLLAPGGGSWSSVSDRATKENLEPVDPRAVLEHVCALPISTWNYTAQDDAIRHMGPMAQDFRAAFGLGVSDRLIDTIDPDGVALAAIQGLSARLNELVAAQEAEIEELREANAALARRVAELERGSVEVVRPR